MTTPAKPASDTPRTDAAETWSYQFDPLDESGRVQVTLNGTAIAEVASLRTATALCERMNKFRQLERENAELREALDALAKSNEAMQNPSDFSPGR